MKALVLGSGGQLGRALRRTAPADMEVIAVSRAELDITDHEAVWRRVSEARPQLIINAAAYTAVDRAESEREAALAANAYAPAALAGAATDIGCRMIHVSTDFVFDGDGKRPYRPEDPVRPINFYGWSKCIGEARVRDIAPDQAVIVRTAWLYGPEGGNFLSTMLRLMSQRREVAVVDDQVGTPTSTDTLADAVWKIAVSPQVQGIHHWTDAGVASWYDFAVAIEEEARQAGLLEEPVQVRPTASSAFRTVAKRPAWSVLDKSETWTQLESRPQHWRVVLRDVIRRNSGGTR